MADMLKGKSAPLLDYDAVCAFVFGDYKDFARFMYDPESKALTPDRENFSKPSPVVLCAQGGRGRCLERNNVPQQQQLETLANTRLS